MRAEVPAGTDQSEGAERVQSEFYGTLENSSVNVRAFSYTPPPTYTTHAATMPQNEYIERFTKQHGKRFDHEERTRKKAAREVHHASERSQNLRGLRAKLYQQKRHKEKIQMK